MKKRKTKLLHPLLALVTRNFLWPLTCYGITSCYRVFILISLLFIWSLATEGSAIPWDSFTSISEDIRWKDDNSWGPAPSHVISMVLGKCVPHNHLRITCQRTPFWALAPLGTQPFRQWTECLSLQHIPAAQGPHMHTDVVSWELSKIKSRNWIPEETEHLSVGLQPCLADRVLALQAAH